MTDVAAPIALAHEPAFALGPLTVRPSTREVVGGAATEVLEPRVMQVLVALHRAGGGIVSRDDLTRSCWEGRVVGEDAINRVISRLRRTAEATGAFRIETVTKVGYRLMRTDAAAARDEPVTSVPAAAPANRRWVMGAGVAVAVGTVAGGGWWLTHRRAATPASALPPEAGALMQQAAMGMRQADPEGNAQAVGIYRRVVQIAPGYADGWGALALAYASALHGRSPAFTAEMTARTRDAAARALALDPDNGYARLAIAAMKPAIGNWLELERAAHAAVIAHPDEEPCLVAYGGILGSAGRNRDAAPYLQHCVALNGPSPGVSYSLAAILWSAGRLDDADRAINEAFALYPTHFAVWFTRFYMLMYGGRPAEAIALAENRGTRPNGIPADNFDLIIAQALAIDTRRPADIEAAMRTSYAASRVAAGNAENAMGFAASVGRLDDAFAIANAYYFGRGFEVAEVRYSSEQGLYTRRDDRRTFKLFQPPTAAMRADARFATLTDELKLTDFWRRSGVKPDYQRG